MELASRSTASTAAATTQAVTTRYASATLVLRRLGRGDQRVSVTDISSSRLSRPTRRQARPGHHTTGNRTVTVVSGPAPDSNRTLPPWARAIHCDDAETEAAALDGGAVAGVAAEEPLEDPRLQLARKARPGVGDHQFRVGSVPGAATASPGRAVRCTSPRCRRGSAATGEGGVGLHARPPASQAVSVTARLCALPEVLHVLDRFPDQFVERHRIQGQRHLACIGLREQGQAVHDLGQPLDLVELAEQPIALRRRSGTRHGTRSRSRPASPSAAS